jgi:hypothetical protein
MKSVFYLLSKIRMPAAAFYRRVIRLIERVISALPIIGKLSCRFVEMISGIGIRHWQINFIK